MLIWFIKQKNLVTLETALNADDITIERLYGLKAAVVKKHSFPLG